MAQAGNAVNNAAQAVKAAYGEILYRAIIPAGAKLTDSKAMEGAVRGIYHGADGIRGHATRRKRVGFDGVVHFIPGLFNDDLNFRSIEKKTASMIAEQSSGHETAHKADTSELYAEDVQFQILTVCNSRRLEVRQD